MLLKRKKRNNDMENPNIQGKPGLKCPRCGSFIETSMEQIITGTPLFCPKCHLKLSIDMTKSREAIDALKKVKEAKDRVEKASHFSR